MHLSFKPPRLSAMSLLYFKLPRLSTMYAKLVLGCMCSFPLQTIDRYLSDLRFLV